MADEASWVRWVFDGVGTIAIAAFAFAWRRIDKVDQRVELLREEAAEALLESERRFALKEDMKLWGQHISARFDKIEATQDRNLLAVQERSAALQERLDQLVNLLISQRRGGA